MADGNESGENRSSRARPLAGLGAARWQHFVWSRRAGSLVQHASPALGSVRAAVLGAAVVQADDKNAVRYLLRVQERPISMVAWTQQLQEAEFNSVVASSIGGEAGVVIGQRSVAGAHQLPRPHTAMRR